MTEEENQPAHPSAASQEVQLERLESAISPYDGTESGGEVLAWLAPILKPIDPSALSDSGLLRVVTAVREKTSGNDDGLELAAYWSGKSRQRSEIEAIWYSQKPAPAESTNVAIITETSAETDADATAHSDLVETPLCASESVIADTGVQTPVQVKDASNPLAKYSLRDKLQSLMALAVTAFAVLGQLVLMGQFTIFFAAANTGKTLLMFFLLIEAIQLRRVDPANVYYFNMDDNAPGLIEKVRIAVELGFNIVAEGYENFSVKKFIVEITAMIENNQAHGVVIFLDTYKKFANVMDKSQASQFNKLLRRFVMKGGTVIALAHTNKKPGMDGRPVYGGTSDSVDDCDCAYIMWSLPPQAGSSEKIIQFENIKRRGNVVQSAAYSYSSDPAISYSELLASVQIVDDAQLAPVIQAETIRSDAGAIAAAEDCIREGINTKMLLADAVAKRTGRSKRSAMQVVEKYTGDDPSIHRWTYSVHARGAKVFELLPSAPPLPGTVTTPPDTPTDDAL
jgi:hypothetical protein